jgi:4-hydroxy-3-polyprenylbenzoate decarboxylase
MNKIERPTASFDTLRDYLDLIRSKGLVEELPDTDWDLEIGAITEVVALSKAPRALLFDRIKGYGPGWRVATNLYASPQLQAIALGLPDDIPVIEMVRRWREKSRNLTPIPPRVVADGPVRQNVERGNAVNILKFPVPRWHEHDGGRYFGTGDLVITRDPQENWVNLGVYRAQVHDERTLGVLISAHHHGNMHMQKFWARGEDAPIVITAGQDPHTYAAACMPLGWGKSEYDMAGAFRQAPVDVILEPRTQLPIPASAEIAVIGHVPSPQKETRIEGPFGECVGYYTNTGPALVVHIDEVWYRDDPIMHGSPPMRGSAMRHALGGEIMTSALIWESVEREVPGVTGVYSLAQPCQTGTGLVALAVDQKFPGHAKQAALAALASHAAVFRNRAVIVVDSDVDASDIDDVMFAFTTRCNPAEDIDLIRGIPGSFFDPRISPERRAAGDSTGSAMIINACRPFTWRAEFPRVNAISPELRDQTLAKWGKRLGL